VQSLVFEGSRNESGFVYRPHSCGGVLPLWFVSIEIQVEASGNEFFETLLGMCNLTHVSLSREEPLDLDKLARIDVDTFPWSHWRLVRAAVRDGPIWVTSPVK
jgi:hypothetical protein